MIKYKNDKQKNFIKECIRRAGNDETLFTQYITVIYKKIEFNT